jgi:(p)ppGpp synthase/HD superfamily hydrolase
MSQINLIESKIMYSYAQTNIQLFNQLQRDGYSNTDLSCILKAYQLTMRLFTGGFRASGKTFIAHLVGTASILSSLHTPTNVVAASLIHAAYTNGDFGDGKTGISQARRKQVRCAVGYEVEEYVARYTALQWNEQTIAAICDRLDSLDKIDRDVLLIRLANELEEYLDLGIIYCGDIKYQRYIHHHGNLIVKIANNLGFPTLAIQLEKAFKETANAEIAQEFCNQTGHNSSYLIVPRSCRKRVSLSVFNWLVAQSRYWRSAADKLRVWCSSDNAGTQFQSGSQNQENF